VNDDDLIAHPSQRLCPPLQIVLPGRTFPIFMDLAERRLADVQISLSPQMFRSHLAGCVHVSSFSRQDKTISANNAVQSDRTTIGRSAVSCCELIAGTRRGPSTVNASSHAIIPRDKNRAKPWPLGPALSASRRTLSYACSQLIAFNRSNILA